MRALRSRGRRFLLGLTLGSLASAVVAAATAQGFFFGYPQKALDLYLWAQGRTRAPEIVLVAIDDAAFRRLNERQPLSRKYLAGVIRGLRQSGARLIGLDVDLRRATIPSEDRALAAAIRGAPGDPAGQVVVARTFGAVPMRGGEVRYRLARLYDPTLEEASGFAEVLQDQDGFFRRLPLVVPLEEGPLFPSLSLTLLVRLGGRDAEMLRRSLAGPEPIELPLPEWDEARAAVRSVSPLRFSRDDDWKINFIGPPGSYLTVGSDAVYQVGVSKELVAQDNPFRGKIVLVGATFAESRETYPTPRGIMPGVEIHANILHSLLARRQIQPIAWGTSLLLQLGLCLGISALFAVLPSGRALILSLGFAGALALALSLWPGTRHLYWFDLPTPILAIRLSSQLHDAMERRRIRQSFHDYIGREVADRVYRDDPSLRGQRRTVSILSADLRDFTSLSEGMAAEQVAQHLNEYFPRMVEAIQRHRGIINDFTGDAVLAVFGAPLENPDHPLDAIRAALAMQTGVKDLNAEWQARGWPTLKQGIGIHTGPVFVGNVGAPRRKKYTVVGDAVNVAVRVEGLNKALATTTLMTSETYLAVKDQVEAKEWGEKTVKGRTQPVAIYEVVGLKEPAAASQGRRGRWQGDGGFSWGWGRHWSRRAASPRPPESPSQS